MGPKVLDRILSALPRFANANVLVGFEGNDDAGVYRLTPELAIVQTVDFFTPIVDDPATYGAIAAANALSDVYAMGGRPVSALSILTCPSAGDAGVIGEILRGGAEKLEEAGVALVGGHSVADEEIKFGYAVTGVIHPERIKANSGARDGDTLVFTKRLGTGVITTALKRGWATAEDVQAVTASMLDLNRAACEAMLAFEVHGCTDVTGFGFLGHAREMALASRVTLEMDHRAFRFLPGALEYARRGAIPAGGKNNREFAAPSLDSAIDIPVEVMDLLYDPQTSGGLLIAMPEADARAFLDRYAPAHRVGRVLAAGGKPLRMV